MQSIQKDEMLDSVIISYYSHKKQFYSSAELKIDGYTITLEREYFETIDEAVQNIKNRISEAVVRFNQPK